MSVLSQNTVSRPRGGETPSEPVNRPTGDHSSTITWPEWRWLGVVSLVILLLVEIPYRLAYAQETRGVVFTGMLWTPHDVLQYLAAMREGAASPSWLVHDHLTGEPHEPAFMYPFYVGLGKLAGLFGVDPQLAFHASGVAARAGLGVTIYLLCATVYPTVDRRRLAFVLVVFSSGFGFWLLLLESVFPFMGDRHLLYTADLWPDVSTFPALFLAPHHVVGLALLLLGARWYGASWTRSGLRYPVQTGLAALGLGLANPFSLVTLGAILPAHLALMCWRRGRVVSGPTLAVGLALLAAAPFAAYSLLIFGVDPFWGTVYGQQNTTPSPPLPSLLLGLAPVLALGAFGLPTFAAGDIGPLARTRLGGGEPGADVRTRRLPAPLRLRAPPDSRTRGRVRTGHAVGAVAWRLNQGGRRASWIRTWAAPSDGRIDGRYVLAPAASGDSPGLSGGIRGRLPPRLAEGKRAVAGGRDGDGRRRARCSLDGQLPCQYGPRPCLHGASDRHPGLRAERAGDASVLSWR
jgi:hypothetical protein